MRGALKLERSRFQGCAWYPTVKRSASMPASRSRPAEGYRDALDSFVRGVRSEEVRDCLRKADRTLLTSSSFTHIVRQLNKSYASAAVLEKAGGVIRFKPDADGLLTRGPFAGRRTLDFNELTDGNRFVRAGSFQLSGTSLPHSDSIFISFPMGAIVTDEGRTRAIAGFVGSIAHEAVHAFHRVSSAGPPPSAPRDKKAQAFITEEIATRKKEKVILREIQKKAKSPQLRSLIKARAATIQLSRPAVERDFVSGSRLTYLETFVLEDLIQESILKDGLEPSTVQQNMTLVARLVFDRPIDTVLQSEHPEWHTRDPKDDLQTVFLPDTAVLLLRRRVLEMDWANVGPDNKETVVQRHAATDFPPEIRYTPLPPGKH